MMLGGGGGWWRWVVGVVVVVMVVQEPFCLEPPALPGSCNQFSDVMIRTLQ
jgi:hypothetical protein